ncbi:hypothetical protein [Muribaculum intestinale]|uniref:hypothetical protein n=1 Tax=Muribaculum intestinale TaxID=1796646 RepID=UPI002431855C|nr:hypothetical protein [Muribaculum intestinale]
MKRWQNNLYMVGLLLIEAIIMLYAVPKANADEISMKISLGIALFLAILVSLALLVKGNQGNYKAIIPIFIVCVATYIQILYCAAFYSWGASVCMTLPIFQLILGYAIFRYSNDIVSLFIGCSNLMFSTIWANQYQGFLWFHNKSGDLETMAVASLCAVIGALIVFTVSTIMIMKFIPKTH